MKYVLKLVLSQIKTLSKENAQQTRDWLLILICRASELGSPMMQAPLKLIVHISIFPTHMLLWVTVVNHNFKIKTILLSSC